MEEGSRGGGAQASVKGYAYVYGYVARCGATFAAQLIKQVERKLLIVCAERQLEKNLPEPFVLLPYRTPAVNRRQIRRLYSDLL